MTESIIKRILSPMSVGKFTGTYFQKQALLIPGRPGKFDFLFRQEQFPCRLDRTSEIRAVFPGLWQATIDPGDIKEMFNAGATICVTGMEQAHIPLRRAARRIQGELRYPGRVSFRAYLSPARCGFDVHYDARVATTLQIAGTKRWWYSKEPAVPFPDANSPHPPDGRGPRPPSLRSMDSVLLHPGDLLCLPAGAWHRARAESTSLALNLAFDHNRMKFLDSTFAIVAERLDEVRDWRKPLPLAPGAPSRTVPPAVAADLRNRINRLQRELTALQSSQAALRRLWLGAFADE